MVGRFHGLAVSHQDVLKMLLNKSAATTRRNTTPSSDFHDLISDCMLAASIS